MPSPTQPFPWFRALVFAGLTVAMCVGPVNNLVLGNPWHRFFKPWRMYYGFGTDVCEVTYVQVSPTGEERTLDRYAVLDVPDPRRAPEDLRNLPDGPTIGRVAQRMCDALPGRRTAIHARVRCAAVRGWKPFPELDRDLCALGTRQLDGLRPARGRRR